MRAILVLACLVFLGSTGSSQDIKFPRQLTSQGAVLTIYQPQVQHWKSHKILDFLMAFSINPVQGKEELGVLYMTARTDTDMESHRVKVDSFFISAIHFPALSADSTAAMGKLVRSFLTPDRSLVMSVEQVVAYLENDSLMSTVTVNNDPPIIFVSKKPTILLQLEGPQVKSDASKEQLEYVINSNYPLFFDKVTSSYFLYDGLEWRKSSASKGPWAFTGKLPTSLTNLTKDSNWVQLKDILPAVASPSKKMPDVYYAEQPAELILFEEEPVYKAISGTTLKYATNTGSDIFYCGSDKLYYYLSSGRWFSASGFSGPWTFASNKLPADFKKIPHTNAVSSILVYVPGTDQAKDAALIAQIPVVATINAQEAPKQVKIVYAGEPQFKPIDSTTLFYAVNTSDKVIKVSNTDYYACVNAVWFVSSTPNGPWKTATSVPASIYSMPASSPVYNVTYVTQTVYNTTYVQSSYTSGYMGMYAVASPYGVVVVSGTGYYHPPYYYYPPYGYPVCYHYYPMTYGCYAYKPYYGGVAYKSAYNPYTGTYARSATAYGPYGSASVAQAYNPYTGTYARGASASTAYGSRSAAQAYNPYTGAGAATRQGSNPYGQWGSSVVTNGSGQWAQTAHSTTANGTVAAGQTSSGGKMVAGSGSQGSGAVAKTGSGDVYAAKDGNVYKKTDEGWNKYGNGGWNNANSAQQQPSSATQASASQAQSAATQAKSSASQASASQAQLNQDYQNRQRSNSQTQQYNNSSSSMGNRSSTQARGGGGRRR